MKYRIVLTTAIAILALALSACYEQSLTSDEYNQPHPVSPNRSISFAVPDCMPVRIDIFNVQGQMIGTPFDTIACDATTVDLVDPVLQLDSVSGHVDTLWPGIPAVASGIYFYQIVTPVDTVTGKLVLVK